MKKNWILGISATVAGLLLIICPAFCIKLLVVLFGLTLIIEGFYGAITERKLFENEVFQKTTLYKSIASIFIGVLTIVMPLAVAGIAWKVMIYVLAVFLVVSGVAGFFASSKLKQIGSDDTNEVPDRKNLTWENALTLAAGIVLFIIGPDKLGVTVIRIVGAVVLIVGILSILLIVLQKNDGNEVKADYEVKDQD